MVGRRRLKRMDRTGNPQFVVMGAGVAGLRAAASLARVGRVLVVTKEAVAESNTHYAQGGIAVALEGVEDVALHLEDTVQAGDGLVDRQAAEVLVTEGPLRVEELISWGAEFDRVGGQLHRTREGAHSLARILHANGDATGAEISRALAAYCRRESRIEFAEWTMVTSLLVEDGRVVGCVLMDRAGKRRQVRAQAVLLAAGGAGQVYSDTTNPAVATGDGLALAAKAGAVLADMEFYQFHPTAFALDGAPRFLLSEALRGEGAWLRNDRGERFMVEQHERMELAPRDVVARAITREGMGDKPGQLRPVYLDMRQVTEVDVHQRFPGISAFLAGYGLDLKRDLVPVRPAAHYLMGGVRTDVDGRTTVPGLYAAGEVACTGVHGANRLASNSLLEGLVFGARAAEAILADGVQTATPETAELPAAALLDTAEEAQVESIIAGLQADMWAYAGLLREATTLEKGQVALASRRAALAMLRATGRVSRRLLEAESLAVVADSILTSAQARTESRGAHYRNDYPQRDDEKFHKHSAYQIGRAVSFADLNQG